jgi:drug/metabolite transporter (DMT)-like permease
MTPLAALVFAWSLTALWPLIGAAGMRHYSGGLFTTAGLCVGLTALSPYLLAQGRWRRVLSRRTAPSLAAMGFCSGAATVIYISALAHTTPANAAIVAQVEVLYSAALTAWLLGERPSLKQTLAALLIMSGTGLVMLDDLSSPRWKGDLMILATPWLYQLSHIAAKRLPRDLDVMVLAGGRVFYGILTVAPFCVWSLFHGARWSNSPEALATLLAQGLLMSSLNFVLWYMAIRNMELSTATTFMLSYPALTLVFSWALGHEAISGVQITGLACSFAGAAWTARLTRAAQLRAAEGFVSV